MCYKWNVTDIFVEYLNIDLDPTLSIDFSFVIESSHKILFVSL